MAKSKPPEQSEVFSFSIDQPFTPEAAEYFPPNYRPYLEAARLSLMEDDRQHKEKEGHTLLSAPICFTLALIHCIDRTGNPDIGPEERMLRLTKASILSGIVLAYVGNNEILRKRLASMPVPMGPN